MAFLRGEHAAPETGKDAREENPALSDEIEETLRRMGYNRLERERWRRGLPRERKREGNREVAVKRLRFYIRRRVPDLPESRTTALAARWATIIHYNVDLAELWWEGGIDPQEPEQFAGAIFAGLRPEHLAMKVGGRTIGEHLAAGDSLRWCMGAIGLSTAAERSEGGGMSA